MRNLHTKAHTFESRPSPSTDQSFKREWQTNRTTTDIRRTEQNNEDKAFKKLAAHCTL